MTLAPAPSEAWRAAFAVSSGTRPMATIRSPPAALEQAYRSENSISPICSFRIASALFKPSLISVSIVVKLCAVPRIFSSSTSTAVILV